MLAELMPIALRFLKDPYDDTSITVFPLINEILNSVGPSLFPHDEP